MHKISAIIVAAGRGRRAGGGLPKQYRKLGGEMVLTKTLNAFARFAPLICVIHPDDADLFKQAIAPLSFPVKAVTGGASRTASVKAGLNALKAFRPDKVLIHDAARPFVSEQIINDVIDALSRYDAVVPALALVDAIKTKDGAAVDRDSLRAVQTPQGFDYAKLMQAYDQISDGAALADDTEVAHKAGLSVGFCQGEKANLKLTYEDDFMERRKTISASGFDVHRICQGDSLTLCGIRIDAGFALKGHSDADVGLHALTDALLGTIGAGDIGSHFPPSDPQWKGANSTLFLSHAAELVRAAGGEIEHVDLTLICERPKIGPHRQAMRTRIADILALPLAQVSLKATTTEGLGFTGRGEGIAAQAIANVSLPL